MQKKQEQFRVLPGMPNEGIRGSFCWRGGRILTTTTVATWDRACQSQLGPAIPRHSNDYGTRIRTIIVKNYNSGACTQSVRSWTSEARRSKIPLQGVFCIGRLIPTSRSRRCPEHLELLRVCSHADQAGTLCQRNTRIRQARTHTHTKKTKNKTRKRAKGGRKSTRDRRTQQKLRILHCCLC